MPLWICSQEKAHVSGEIYQRRELSARAALFCGWWEYKLDFATPHKPMRRTSHWGVKCDTTRNLKCDISRIYHECAFFGRGICRIVGYAPPPDGDVRG